MAFSLENLIKSLTPPDLSVEEQVAHAEYMRDYRHRIEAFGRIDAELTKGQITPEEAEERKRFWMTLHSST